MRIDASNAIWLRESSFILLSRMKLISRPLIKNVIKKSGKYSRSAWPDN